MFIENICGVYAVINGGIAATLLLKSRSNRLSQFYAFCVACLIVLAGIGSVLIRVPEFFLRGAVYNSGVFLYSLIPFFFLHLVVVFLKRFDILNSRIVLPAVYFVGLFSYTLVLLKLIPHPIPIDSTIPFSGYIYYITWMSIFFAIGVAMLYSMVGGFSERGINSNLLFSGFALLLLILPGPFTETITSTFFGEQPAWYFGSSMLALTASIYLVFRHKIIVNTPYETLKAALAAMNDVLFKTDESFRVQLAGGATTSLLGYSERELVGRSLTEFVREKKLLEAYRDHVFRGVDKESVFDAEVAMRDGVRLAMNFSVTPVYANGEVTGFVVVGRNITERRLVELSPDAIVMYRNKAIVFANAAALRLFGAQRAVDVLDRPFKNFIHPLHSALVEDQLSRHSEEEATVPATEAKFVRLDGNLIDVELKATPFTYEASPAMQIVLRDVTERKAAEAKLRESEELFRLITENVTDLIALVDFDGRRIYNNPAYGEILGDPDLLKGTDSFREIHPDDVEYVKQTFGETVRTGIGRRAEYRFLLDDGRIRYIESQGNIIRDANGTASRMIIVSRDITERRKAEEEIRENEKRFRALTEHSSDVIALIDESAVIRYVSPPVTRVLGYAVAEFVGRNGFDDMHPADLARNRALLDQLVKDPRQTVQTEFRYRHKDGSWNWIEAVGNNLLHHPRIRSIVVNFRDITARKLAEEKVREQASLLNISHDAIVVCDTEEHVLFWNRGAQQVYGWPPDEAVGKEVTELFGITRAQYQAVWRAVLEQNEWTGELQQRTRSAREIIVQSRWTLMRDDEGAPKSVLIVNSNISQKKKLELELIHMQKMESIGTLAGGIAHDFNNILAIVMAHVSKLTKERALPERLVPSVEAIKQATQRGAGLVRQLLTFARKSEVSLELVQVNDMLTELVKLLRETFPRTLTIISELTPGTPPVWGDPNQLHQVFLNVCINARDAIPSAGRIRITTGVVSGHELRTEFQDAIENSYVAVRVSDSGTGMDEGTKRRIFEPFFTTKGVGQGTGLGLATVYGIVESHRGFIGVDTAVGAGTTFRLYLPVSVQSADPVRGAEAGPAKERGRYETILIVEDEDLLREFLFSLFTEEGYSVLTAEDGESALQMFSKSSKDISFVLCDLGLPKLGGSELFAEMRKIKNDIPVLFASGYIEPALKSQLIDQGATDFVQKPYVPEEMLKKVRVILDRTD